MMARRLFAAHAVFAMLPATRCFGVKRALLRWAGADIGAGVRICSSVRIYLSGPLRIGADTWVGHHAVFLGGDAPIEVGARVDIGPQVTLVGGNHAPGLHGRAAGDGFSKPIRVGDGAWLGARSTILGGVEIGAGAVVGAAALVNADVAPGARVGGVPARELGRQATATASPS